jgi:hypothetical protein
MSLFVVCIYLLGFLGSLLYCLFYLSTPAAVGIFSDSVILIAQCGTIGGIAGVLYCLRGVYRSKCVYKNWDTDWLVWYFVRPIASIVCGGVSFLFLKAGLLLLDASRDKSSNDIGLYALAFIAGLNVDKFLQKIEEIGNTAWGIEKSRSAKPEATKEN